MHVTVKDNTDSSTISDLSITATNIRTSEKAMEDTDANGLVVFDQLCEGSDLMVVATGSCNGSYVFYRLDKVINEVDFFVSC